MRIARSQSVNHRRTVSVLTVDGHSLIAATNVYVVGPARASALPTVGVCPGRLRVPDKPDENTGRLVPTIEFWHPQHLRWDSKNRRWLIRVGDYGATEVEVTPGVDGWLLFTPYGQDRPWSLGIWRGLARWWLLKSYSIDDAGRHSEKPETVH